MTGFVQVRGAREHNLKNINVDIPRDSFVVFTGVSGSGKSSLAFGTLYGEAQRRYLESVAPYARRLFHQMGVPQVDSIDGLPPAVALQQQRGTATTRSSVGSVTTLSNLLRMLYSRAGDYPKGQGIIYAAGFSPNTPEGACEVCHGLGRVYDVTEASMVPDPSKTIRERAIAAWPTAWGGQNQRDILVSMGIDVDVPWKTLPRKTRDWILFTDEQPQLPVYPGYTPKETRDAIKRKEPPNYMGTFTGVKRHVLSSFSTTQSASMKKRSLQFMIAAECGRCHGKRLKREALSVTFAGLDIAEISQLPLKRLATLLHETSRDREGAIRRVASIGSTDVPPNRFLTVAARDAHPEKTIVRQRIGDDMISRLEVLLDLGLGYLTLDRSTPTLSPGELQRLRLATQVRSNLFGVVYVLDEPSAGLHPADTQALLRALDRLKESGNSLFVVEHELDVIRHADWIIDVGPAAGEAGGEILYSGPREGLATIEESRTRRYLFEPLPPRTTPLRKADHSLKLEGVTRNNLSDLSVKIPLRIMTSVTGISGSGKSSLISQALVELVAKSLGQSRDIDDTDPLEADAPTTLDGKITSGIEHIRRLVVVDQKPIGRTPRSNLATYTGLFDHVRKLFASTTQAKKRHYDAGQFSFNVAKGRCENCDGEGSVFVELLFLPSVYAPCPVCGGSRYNAKTLEVQFNGKNIAEVLAMTVNDAAEFFTEDVATSRPLQLLQQVGLGYLRLGQPATELSGGEAQRIKLATELQRTGRDTLYILDEPTTGLHPFDVEKLLAQLNTLVDAGNTVVLVEHDMHVVSQSDHVIDIGPGAGDEGGRIVAQGTPRDIAKNRESRTSKYLREIIG